MRLAAMCIVLGFSIAAGRFARAEEPARQSSVKPAIAVDANDLLLAWDDDPPPPAADAGAPPPPDDPRPPRRGDRDRPRRPPSPEGEGEIGPPGLPVQRVLEPPPDTKQAGGGRFGDLGGEEGPPRPHLGGPHRGGDRFGGDGDVRFGPPRANGRPGMDVAASDPEMWKLSHADMQLEKQTRELADQYRQLTLPKDALDADVKRKIHEKLTEVVEMHFQIRQERRELELKRLEKQLNHLREVIAKRTEAKQTIIKGRMSQLLGVEDDLSF